MLDRVIGLLVYFTMSGVESLEKTIAVVFWCCLLLPTDDQAVSFKIIVRWNKQPKLFALIRNRLNERCPIVRNIAWFNIFCIACYGRRRAYLCKYLERILLEEQPSVRTMRQRHRGLTWTCLTGNYRDCDGGRMDGAVVSGCKTTGRRVASCWRLERRWKKSISWVSS